MNKLLKLKFNDKNLNEFHKRLDRDYCFDYINDSGKVIPFILRDVVHYWGFGDCTFMKVVLGTNFNLLKNPSKDLLYREYIFNSCHYYSQKYYDPNRQEFIYEKIPECILNHLTELAKIYNILEYDIRERNWLDKLLGRN